MIKIIELDLLSNDLDSTIEFYNNTLELRSERVTDSSITFVLGDTRLTFHKSTVQNPTYHIAIDIPHNQLTKALDWVGDRFSILPVTPDSLVSIFDVWNAESFYFFDNNGNLLELIARKDLDNASDAAFDSSSMLYVSEIGIPSDDVPTAVDRLLEDSRFTIYNKQPRADNFTAVGEETGLLIYVKQGRNWFPTDVPAKAYWTKIVIETRDGLKELICE